MRIHIIKFIAKSLIPFRMHYSYTKIHYLRKSNEEKKSTKYAYPYLDVAHLHLEFSKHITVIRQKTIMTPDFVTAVCIVVFASRITLTFAQIFLVVRLKQQDEFIQRKQCSLHKQKKTN